MIRSTTIKLKVIIHEAEEGGLWLTLHISAPLDWDVLPNHFIVVRRAETEVSMEEISVA
jgi:hypothetical protein